MKLPGQPLPKAHLQPGDLLVTQEAQWVITLLGSCVAVTMYNERFHLAAICHAMLPEPRDTREPVPSQGRAYRYMSHAIPAMTERFLHLGLKPDEVDVKMFGGGNVINMGGVPNEDRSIGNANIAIACRLLGLRGFKIKAQNVGGDCGCKILFNTQSGEVLHKLLSRGAAKRK